MFTELFCKSSSALPFGVLLAPIIHIMAKQYGLNLQERNCSREGKYPIQILNRFFFF